MPGGRPSLYDPAYCEKVIALGAKGKSEVGIAVALGVPRSTLQSWASQHDGFRQALTQAKEASQDFWEDKALSGCVGNQEGQINPAVWKHSMVCRFGEMYNPPSRQEHSGPDGGPIETRSRSDLEDELRKLLARSGKGAEGASE